MAQAIMAVVEDSSRGEAVVTEAVEVSNEVAVDAKVDTSRKQQVFRPSHSTRRAALQLSEATMVVWAVEVLVGAAATTTSTAAVALKEQQTNLLMAEMEATITSTSPGSSTMSSTGRASSTKVVPTMIASRSTRANSRSQLE